MNKKLSIIVLAAVLAFSIILNAYLYIQNQNLLPASRHADQETNFYNEFGIIPASNFACPFSPPISMYRALQIGLESEGWNKTSLVDKIVEADFVYVFVDTGAMADGVVINRRVTTPPANYSSVEFPFAGVDEYAWEITVNNVANASSQPLGLSLVDAQTGSLLPKPSVP